MNQNVKKAHLFVVMEVFDYRHFNGKDPQKPRPSTMVKGVMQMPDGFKSSVEFFIDEHHHFNTPMWKVGLRIGADWKNRLHVDPVSWEKLEQKVA